jgi:hypothetical protein
LPARCINTLRAVIECVNASPERGTSQRARCGTA